MTLNLRSRFLLLFGLIFVLGGAVGYRFFDWYASAVMNELGQRFAERNVLYEKSKILGIVTREVTLAQKMASSPVLRTWAQQEAEPAARIRAIEELEDFRGFFRSHSYFFALAKSGHYFYNDDRGGFDPVLPRYTLDRGVDKDGWFYVTLDKVKDTQLNVDTDRVLGLTKVWINTVVRDPAGKAVAVTGTGVDLSDFIRSVVSSPMGGAANVLVDRHGAIQAHQDVSMIDFASVRKAVGNEAQNTVFSLLDHAGDAVALRQAMAALVAGDAEVLTLELQIQGHRQLTGIVWVPEIQWFVLTMTHPEAAIGAAGPLTKGALLVICLLGVLLIAAAYWLERTVVSRLARLDDAAQALADGQFPAMPADASGDEIGRLNRSFRHMAERISRHTEDLEHQVSDRTEALERMAHTDFLTAVLNRRGMMQRLAVEQNRLGRSGEAMGILIVDIDHFKRINDTRGHAVGDFALVEVAKMLRESVRTYDAVARWGGEEFLIGLFGLSNFAELENIANKLLTVVRERTLTCDGLSFALTYCIGGVLADPAGELDEIIRQADDALYRAKHGGRDRAILVDASLGGAQLPAVDPD
ncbi:MAG: diguanylate cyclase [Azonexus sp.]|nr:diguanylate cyclase [Azonexus sp.]